MDILCFQFQKHIFSAHYREQIVVLDVVKNEYVILGNKATIYLPVILNQKFKLLNNTYILSGSDHQSLDLQELNVFIRQFMDRRILEVSPDTTRKMDIARAHLPIGISQVEWLPNKKETPIKTDFSMILSAIIALVKVQFTLKKNGLQGFVNLLQRNIKKSKKFSSPNITSVEAIAYMLDKACLLYPKKILCLPWAGALMLLLLRQKWDCHFCIGVQTLPFYAHAWIEVNGMVINDNPQIQQRLAPILKISSKQGV